MTLPADSLDEYLAFSGEELTEDELTITDNIDANRVMRRLRGIYRAIDGNRAVAEAETDRINNWEREVNAPLERQAVFFAASLKGFMTHVRDGSGGKIKSINLPAGKISTTATSAKWEVADKDAFTEWAKREGRTALFRVKHEPETLTVLKTHLTEDDEGNAILVATGETVPGVKVTAPEAPFNVTIKPTN